MNGEQKLFVVVGLDKTFKDCAMKSTTAEEIDRIKHWNTVLDKDIDTSSVSSGSVNNTQSKESRTCKYCKREFSGVSNLNKHINGVHRRIRPFVCHKCGSAFQYKSMLKNHENSVHLGIRPYECSHCTKRFTDKSNRSKHMNNLHNFSGLQNVRKKEQMK
ncbi:Zinc finger and BTB domain-containing protein 14 [Gracilariopsis chorda]|uniref:Zinc finger and BTB domain-containing protein 14 n=1 Tax=Gracilariopsis chorda TaxID=448386 RepID=A0A2V3ILH6_9FLOR|nr:Zinc finger and BTB domain-containing protein 14 [Gracilariopsis chorda]|eukprot:PXF42936.1 Zinc finger and BTB domain-containing protein 14 [Gracilariopsis chorda]